MSDPRAHDQLGEAELKRLFQEMRALDEARAPSFAEMMERLRRQSPKGLADEPESSPELRSRDRIPTFGDGRAWRRLGWAGGLLAAAAVAAILLHLPGGGADARFVDAVQSFSVSPAGGAWRSPTDGLLRIPGQAMLNTLPSIGGARGLGSLGSGSPRNQHLRTRT